MAVIPLQKIRIVGMRSCYKSFMQDLHRLGEMEIIQNTKLSQSTQMEVEDHYGVFNLAQIESTIDILSKNKKKSGFLKTLLTFGKLEITEAEAKIRLKKFVSQAQHIINDVEKLKESIIRHTNSLQSYQRQKKEVHSFINFTSPLQVSFDTEQTFTRIFQVTTPSYKKFAENLSQLSNTIDLHILHQEKASVILRLTATKDIQEEAQNVIKNTEAKEITLLDIFPEFEGKTITQIEHSLALLIDQTEDEIYLDNERLEKLSVHVDDLKILYDYNFWRKTKNDLQKHVFFSEYTFAFEAWLPTSRLHIFQKWIKSTFEEDIALQILELKKDEKPPIALKNSYLSRSFEPITQMYGIPGAKDIDPTKFLAPFFFVFFGVCLSDVGYGSILLLFSLFIFIFARIPQSAKNQIFLLVLCAISAIIGGILLGGYFGMSFDQAPNLLINPETGMFYGQLLNPSKSPMQFLLIAMLLGIVQILFGILLDFSRRILQKDYIGAFADSAAWFFFLLSFCLFGVAETIGLPKELMAQLTIAGAIILILTQGRDQKNWFLKPIFGILGLYNITGYLSDLLSYSRIMALGLATGIIGFAMNITAQVLSEMMPHPVAGIILMIAFLIFGHTLNFCLSCLGGFIHSGRLQFIEFFGKFYTGDGKLFAPFIRKTKYLFFSQ